MRALAKILLLAVGLVFSGCAHEKGPFTLTARLVSPTQPYEGHQLSITLRNVSRETQEIFTPANFFNGRVYLRDPKGQTNEFVHRDCWSMQQSTSWEIPLLTVKAGASVHFQHPLWEFMDSKRGTKARINGTLTDMFPTLPAEFSRGSAIWCALDISYWSRPNLSNPREALVETVVSPALLHLK